MTSLARKLEESLEPKPKRRRQRKHKAPPILGPGRPDKYVLSDGKTRVPSVTTITGRFKDASGLIYWAWKEGVQAGHEATVNYEGDNFVDDAHLIGVAKAIHPLDKKKDEAADEGHIGHTWIEDLIGGRPLTEFGYSEPETLKKARTAVEGWKQWRDEVGLVMVECEVPLVSEKLKLGGTPDGTGYVHDVFSVLDWKLGNRIYAEHVIQMAAYRQMLRERDGRKAPRQAVAVRLDKETGKPSALIIEPEWLDLGWEYFRRGRDMYELSKDLEKLVKRKRK